MSKTSLPLYCALVLGGCAAQQPKVNIALTPASKLCADAQPPQGAMCLPTAKLERLLKDGPMSVLEVRPTSSGTAGATMVWLEFPQSEITLKAKWKEAARGGSALNNEPRKELAAYELQKLFLDPEEYVVPPTEGRCIPLDVYKANVRPTKPTFAGSSCAFGVLAYWLEDVKILDPFDAKRFESDLKYRRAIANLNVFTYLLDHRDTRPANFVASKSMDFPRAFAIDNGLALDGLTNPRTAFLHEWNHLFVPKLPSTLVDRLRKITRADLDKLATVAEFAIEGQHLDPIANTDAFVDKDGIRQKGNVIQLGLTTTEIDQIEQRLKSLLERVDGKQLEQY